MSLRRVASQQGANGMSTTVPLYRFTVTDYSRMLESGILDEDDRVELIDGEVRCMSPIGSLHVFVVNRLNAILTQQLAERAVVSVQNPLILDDFTEPQPDIVVMRMRDDFYKHALAGPNDVLLIIEVADSSLEYDRDEKIPRYAQMQIPEVWLVDVEAEEVVRYSEPEGQSYRQSPVFETGQELASVAIESLRIPIDDIFLIGR
jgi:Uma2 family endonuclease